MDSGEIGFLFIQLVQLLIAILMGFWAKSIYEKKGRSPGWGFIIGFFLSILGVLIASLLKSSEKMLNQSSAPKTDETKCPHCLEIIKKGATVCKHCRKDPRITDISHKEEVKSKKAVIAGTVIAGIDIPISVPGWEVTLIFDSIEIRGEGETTFIGIHGLIPPMSDNRFVAVLKGHYTGDLDNLIKNGWVVEDELFYINDSDVSKWKVGNVEHDTHSFTFGFCVRNEESYVLHHGMGDSHWEIDLSPLLSQ